MMPMYGSENCYPLFEQGPCKRDEWYVLSHGNHSGIQNVLPSAHCEKQIDCDVFVLETEHEGRVA